MRTRFRFAAALLVLAACGEGPLAPGRFALDGRWFGRAYPYELALELDHDGDNRVTGQGEVRGLREVLTLDTLALDPPAVDTLRDTVYTDTARFAVDGEWDFPSFTLRFAAPGYADATYAASYPNDGEETLADSLAGRLEGSGFGSASVPVGRVP